MDSLSIDGVARHTSISRRALSRYFGTKQEPIQDVPQKTTR
ncbi:hypothetical protein DM992_34865 [Burkholderia sp. JP2-270]|nr:hypothetical protein DM992_34865 [Burkholderia sp. JP2-270]